MRTLRLAAAAVILGLLIATGGVTPAHAAIPCYVIDLQNSPGSQRSITVSDTQQVWHTIAVGTEKYGLFRKLRVESGYNVFLKESDAPSGVWLHTTGWYTITQWDCGGWYGYAYQVRQ